MATISDAVPHSPRPQPQPQPNRPASDPMATRRRALLELERLEKFHDKVHKLAALWLFSGVVALGIGLYLQAFPADNFDEQLARLPVIRTALVNGCLALVIGVLVFRGNMTVAQVGLGLAYVSAVVQLMVNLKGPGAITIGVIIMSHQVLKQARQLKAAESAPT
ncbi:MAG TPA: hypothetical protein VK447_15795 [Myxococcaceae bacterium]|nr:hypothetical protein [Myxococcaceae bacterium]